MSNEMKLSDQSVGAVMMALQQSLMQQSDIVPVLKNFKWRPHFVADLQKAQRESLSTQLQHTDRDV